MADITIDVDMREFNRAMQKISALNKKGVAEDLHYQAKNLLGKIARKTYAHPRSKKVREFVLDEKSGQWIPIGKMVRAKTSGRARAGWVPAWRKLGMTNLPRGTAAAVKIAGGNEGDFIDESKRLRDPFIEMINQVAYIEDVKGIGEAIDSAVSRQLKFMQRYIERKTRQRMNKHLK